MTEVTTDAGTAAVAETRNSESEVSQAIQLRHQLEGIVLDKGLVRRQDVLGPTSPGSKLNEYKAYHVVPPHVQEALRRDPNFKEIYDLSSISISHHGGGDLVEVGLWDYHNGREGNKIVFSMGSRGALPEGIGGPDIYRIAVIPEEKSEQRYEFQERGFGGKPRALSPEGTFTRMEHDVVDALRALKRLPNTFSPGIRQRVANRIAPGK